MVKKTVETSLFSIISKVVGMAGCVERRQVTTFCFPCGPMVWRRFPSPSGNVYISTPPVSWKTIWPSRSPVPRPHPQSNAFPEQGQKGLFDFLNILFRQGGSFVDVLQALFD